MRVKVFCSTKFGLQRASFLRIILSMSWYHHSRNPRCRTPFGAVKTGETVWIRLDGDAGRSPQLLVDMPGWQFAVPMDWDGACYRARFTAPDYPCRMGYGFRLDDGRFFGSANATTPAINGKTVLFFIYMPSVRPWFFMLLPSIQLVRGKCCREILIRILECQCRLSAKAQRVYTYPYEYHSKITGPVGISR